MHPQLMADAMVAGLIECISEQTAAGLNMMPIPSQEEVSESEQPSRDSIKYAPNCRTYPGLRLLKFTSWGGSVVRKSPLV